MKCIFFSKTPFKFIKKTNEEQENMFVGPSWITNQLQSLYD